MKEKTPEDMAEDYASNLWNRYDKDPFNNEEIEDKNWRRARNDWLNGFMAGRQFEVLSSILRGDTEDKWEMK